MTVTTDDSVRDAHAVPGYELLEILEQRPEVGTTYRAHPVGRDTPLELTIVAPALAGDARYRDRFERRRRLLTSIQHPALVAQLDAGECRAGLFEVTRAAPGAPLRTLLELGPLGPARTVAMLAPVAEVLDRLQAARLSAGDLSPATIVVDEAGRAAVTRIGLSGVSMLVAAGLEVSQVALAYSAPEQLRGLATGSRTDVYGLATVVFEAITGRPLFGGSATSSRSDLAVRAALSSRQLPAPSVSARRPEVGAHFDAVLKAALSESPAARPASAGELVERLTRALGPVGIPRRRGEPDAPRRTPGRAPGEARPDGRDAPPPRRFAAVRPTAATSDDPAAAARRPDPDPAPAAASAPHGDIAAVAPGGHARGPDVASGDHAPAGRVARGRAASMAATPAPPLAARTRRERRAAGNLPSMRATAPAAAVAMLAGVLLAVGDEPARPAQPPADVMRLAAGPLQITHPAIWEPGRNLAGAAQLSLREPAAVVPRPGVEAQPDSRLLAGIVTDTGPSLLAPKLERRLGGNADPEAVRLGAHQAYRYRDVALGGDGVRPTIYAVPTSAGVATIACFAPRFDDTLEGQCEAMATTLVLTGARSLPLGPNADYARLVSRIVAGADVARRHGRTQLRLAKRASGQGRRAADLAEVFRRSAQRLAANGPEAGTASVHRQLVAALREVRNAYDALAAAAAAQDRRAYDAARRVVSAREAGLTRALERLRRLGYRLD